MEENVKKLRNYMNVMQHESREDTTGSKKAMFVFNSRGANSCILVYVCFQE